MGMLNFPSLRSFELIFASVFTMNLQAHDVVEVLHILKKFLGENLRAIDELLRKRDDLQRCRAAANSTATVRHPFSLHDITSGDVDPNGPSELWPAFGSSRAGFSHNDLSITPRASSVPTDITMDSEIAATESPTFRVVDSQRGKCFLCECGHETKTKGDMLRHRETLKHAPRKYLCKCGTRYTRGDGLKRHQRDCSGGQNRPM